MPFKLFKRRTDAPSTSGPTLPPDVVDVSAVTSQELATVRRYLDGRVNLDDRARAGLAAQLAARLRPKVLGAPNSDPEAFLEWLAEAKSSGR